MAGITPDGAVIMASVIASCLWRFLRVARFCLELFPIRAWSARFLSPLSVVWSAYAACGSGRRHRELSCSAVLWAVFSMLPLMPWAPSITRQIVGPRDYTIIYSRVAIVVNLAGAVAATVFAAVAEASWEAEWVMSLILVTVAFASCVAAVRFGKNLEQTLE